MRDIGRGLSSLGSMITKFPQFMLRTIQGAIPIALYLCLAAFPFALTLYVFPALIVAYASAPTPVAAIIIPGVIASILSVKNAQLERNREISNRTRRQGPAPEPIDDDEVNFRVLGATAALACSTAYMPAYAALRAIGPWAYISAIVLTASAGEQMGSSAREALIPRP